MRKIHLSLAVTMAAAFVDPSAAVAANIGKSGKKSGPTMAIAAEYSAYNRGFGSKSFIGASARLPLGEAGVLIVGAATGERRSGGRAIRGSGFSAALHTPLASGLVSRTQLSRGDAGPLFAGRVVGEELAYRWRATELRGGARISSYAGGNEVRSFGGGISQEIGPVRLDYGVAYYAARGIMPRGFIHRAEAALDDRSGTTQLQLGAGTSLHEHDFRPDKVTGSFRAISLKRKQKLGRGLALELGGGWTAFDRPRGRYGAAKVTAGIIVSR